MFKLGLLTSTAMTAVALLLSGATHAAQNRMHVADRDTNSRFLCTYGSFDVTVSHTVEDSLYRYSWQHVAVPFTGRGQTISKVTVQEALSRSGSGSSFSAAIYNNNKGLPGRLLVNGQGKASPSCGPVTIKFNGPITLRAKKKYWIEERAIARNSSSSTLSLAWAVNPKNKRNAYVQTFKRLCSSGFGCSSSTSPWTEQASGPWFKLK